MPIIILTLATLSVILQRPRLAIADSVNMSCGALVGAIRTHISETTVWEEGEIEVRSIANLSGVVLPAGDLSFHVAQKIPPANFRNLILPIEATLEGKAVSTFWIKTEIAIHARVLQAAHRLSFGSTLSSGDITEGLAEITDPHARYLRSRKEATGNILRRTLSPGEPLTRDCITAPILIRSGETVKIRVRRGSISLAGLARAEQNGKLGQMIRVRNLDFSRPVKAEVTGPGEVTIE